MRMYLASPNSSTLRKVSAAYCLEALYFNIVTDLQ